MYRVVSYLSKKCAQVVGAVWDKSVVKRTQVLRSFVTLATNAGSIHSQQQLAGKLFLVLSPVFPQPNSHIYQMEQATYAQYPHSLLLRLLFNIIRERP